MFSEKSKKNADACRFCWMCRHLCPVQLVTGKETNPPRAKVAAGRWNDITRTDAKIMVAACPQSTEALSATVPEGYEYKDLFVMLAERL